jgi:hypothetical protein
VVVVSPPPSQANNLQKDMHSYKGLVESCLAIYEAYNPSWHLGGWARGTNVTADFYLIVKRAHPRWLWSCPCPSQQANNLVKDMHSYKGLVESYLAVHKYKEALSAAKEALHAMPKNPKVRTALGGTRQRKRHHSFLRGSSPRSTTGWILLDRRPCHGECGCQGV